MVSGKGDKMKRSLGHGRWSKLCNGACNMEEVKFNL